MQFLLLIYEDEKRLASGPPESEVAEYAAFTERHAALVTPPKFLQSTGAAKTVRTRNGEGTIRIGPYAETKEQLTGFCVIEADSLDHAAMIALGLPAARHGCIEVRPFRD